MQPNYEEMMRKQQQDYQRSRDPFEYGRQVAQRRYSEIMFNIDAQRQSTQQSYGDLYQQARQRAVGQQAAGGPTLSGGMGQQQRDFASAMEIQQTGQIGTARNQAMRDLYSQGQAAFSNAQLEGQQATQMEVQNRQTELQLLQQRQAIIDSDLPDEQKQAQLAALGGQGASAQITPTENNASAAISAGVGLATTGTIVGTQIAMKVGQRQLASVTAKVLANQGLKAGTTQATKFLASEAGKKLVTSQLGMTGKFAQTFAGKAGVRLGAKIAGTVLGKTIGFAFKYVLPAWMIISSVETVLELAGVNEGKGLIYAKEGSSWDKLLTGIGL